MELKKFGGQVYGANLTAAERKGMNMEIQRQLAVYDRLRAREHDAIILWNLHELFGFGYDRLKRFYDSYDSSVRDLIDRYEMEDSDKVWLCTYKLKSMGIDLEQWEKENRKKVNNNGK